MKQTAVEWLVYQLENNLEKTRTELEYYIEQAKEMEKEQIIQARITSPLLASIDKDDYIKEAEQYYNLTFKSE